MQSINSVSDETKTSSRKYVSLLSDITIIKEHEKELEHIAHYDALTNLPNRVLLLDRLHQNLIQARRREQPLALVYIDLDGFKFVNDNYGHEAGDNLLITVSQRMKKALREGDTLARIGGDEFVAILLDIGDSKACVPILNRVLTAAAQLVYFNHNNLQVSASLGVTFFAHAEEISVNKLLLEADQAMYQAKFEGKNCFHFYNAVKDRYINGYTETLERITQALISHEFVMYYQPQVDMHTGAIIGAEALVRWQHPEKGLLLPDIFLPVIKDQSLSMELGAWIIEAVFEQMEIWHSTGLAISVSINLDSRQLQQTGFMNNLRAQLNAHPTVSPEFLELEVLESSMMEDIIKVSNIIEACNDMNIKCSIDNFGTGYSSLSYLNRLPPTMIKIDRTVVQNMLNNLNERTLVKCIIGLAKTIGLKVMGVGVESIEHGTMLRQLGCDLMQGNVIAHPMMANEFTNWCSTWKPDPVKTMASPISTLV
jgi:diguanylate cyclase (GGDEF)-like protein